ITMYLSTLCLIFGHFHHLPIILVMLTRKAGSMVGYYDPDYFARVFKRKFGVAPSEYMGNRDLRGKSGAKPE
ncbi:MAG: AraC family transcriptional regulator, partial [Clostridiales bacterium]|nr:AraC family transcriptional regulator [Clostridiales bacterium]